MGKFTEKYAPLLISMLVGIIFHFLTTNIIFSKLSQYKDILQSIITLGSISIGFSSAILTILLAVSPTTMTALRENGYIKDLMDYMFEAIYSSVLLVIFGLLGLFLLSKSEIHVGATIIQPSQVVITAISVIMIHNALCFIRNIRLIKLIISLPPDAL